MVKTDKEFQDDSIDLKTIFRLFLKRKWWFIGTLIIVLVFGMLYMWSKPVLYEVRYKFSFEDDLLQDDFLVYSDLQQSYSNESVFIEAKDVKLIFDTEIIFRSLQNIEEIGDDYSDYMNSSLQNLNLENDTGIFSLRVKNTDKKLADDIARNLIESLGTQVLNNDLEIFDNTLVMIDEDIKELEDENISYENKIAAMDEEKKGEMLIYRERIIDNEYKIGKLEELYQKFEDEKSKVHNRVDIIAANPDYNVENDRLINSIIVILLSLLTAIIVVLAVNYIYKLKKK